MAGFNFNIKEHWFTFVKAGVQNKDDLDNEFLPIFLSRWNWGYWIPRFRIERPRKKAIRVNFFWLIFNIEYSNLFAILRKESMLDNKRD